MHVRKRDHEIHPDGCPISAEQHALPYPTTEASHFQQLEGVGVVPLSVELGHGSLDAVQPVRVVEGHQRGAVRANSRQRPFFHYKDTTTLLLVLDDHVSHNRVS